MDKERRIKTLESEIGQFDYQRLKLQEQAQQMQIESQQKLASINEGILTRRGEIICLQKLIEEKENGFSPSKSM